jgi:hypothetical protein
MRAAAARRPPSQTERARHVGSLSPWRQRITHTAALLRSLSSRALAACGTIRPVRRLGLLLVLPLLAGCPICGDGELVVLAGERPITPGSSVQLAFEYDGDTYSTPGACGGIWSVNGVEGGTDAAGTITSCGLYTAPATLPSKPPFIVATKYPEGCADCCPYASIYLGVAGAYH